MKKQRKKIINITILVVLFIIALIGLGGLNYKVNQDEKRKNVANIIYKQYDSINNIVVQYSKLYLRTGDEKYKEDYYNAVSDFKMWLVDPFSTDFIIENTEIESSIEYDNNGVSEGGVEFLKLSREEIELWKKFRDEIITSINERNKAIEGGDFTGLSNEKLLTYSDKSNVSIRILNYRYIERINEKEVIVQGYLKILFLITVVIAIILIYKFVIIIKEFILYYKKDISNTKLLGNLIENMTLGLVMYKNELGYEFINKEFKRIIHVKNNYSSVNEIVNLNKDIFIKLESLKSDTTTEIKVKVENKEAYWQVNKFCIVDTNLDYRDIYIINDLTEEKFNEVQQVELEKQFNEMKVAAEVKESLLANISHEVRTPINAIVGMSDVLKNTEINDLQARYIKNIEDASNILLGIINSILEFSKLNAKEINIKKEAFKISDIIKSVENLFKESFVKKKLMWKVSNNIDNDVIVIGDSIRILQVIINLIGNSIKFTEEGLIEFILEKLYEDDKKIEINFAVKDTGKGIKEENLEKLFLPFEQFDTKGENIGTGLGLAISEKIIKSMGSKITVKSIYGVGSKFEFNLSFDKGEIEKEINKLEIKNNLKESKILLVDDNEINREIGEINLKKLECEYRIAKNGEEAINICKEKGKDYFDIILMDIQMPEMNGYEVSEILKKDLAKNTLIVALTATEFDEKTFKKHRIYMDFYLMKPLNIDELNLKVKKKVKAKKSFEDKLKEFIDYENTLDRLDGNKKLYIKLCNKMRVKYENSTDELKMHLDKNEFKEAYILIHTIKGVAANLGFEELRLICIDIEKEIKKNNKVRKIMIDKFNYEKEKVIKLISELEEE